MAANKNTPALARRVQSVRPAGLTPCGVDWEFTSFYEGNPYLLAMIGGCKVL